MYVNTPVTLLALALALALATQTLAQGKSSSDAAAKQLVSRTKDAVALKNRTEKPVRSQSLNATGSNKLNTPLTIPDEKEHSYWKARRPAH
ncbi:hypothetical protein H4R33_005266 [Dimargaris cristalligena]|nr:hypothetical protein H4R33_005266 [Dimargaris cristalligena]